MSLDYPELVRLKYLIQELVEECGWGVVIALIWDIVQEDTKIINREALLEKLNQVLEEV